MQAQKIYSWVVRRQLWTSFLTYSFGVSSRSQISNNCVVVTPSCKFWCSNRRMIACFFGQYWCGGGHTHTSQNGQKYMHDPQRRNSADLSPAFGGSSFCFSSLPDLAFLAKGLSWQRDRSVPPRSGDRSAAVDMFTRNAIVVAPRASRSRRRPWWSGVRETTGSVVPRDVSREDA